MNYFTPDLMAKLQAASDAAAFRAVNAEWEQAAEHYQAHLLSLAPHLPDGARRLMNLGSLHDARVVTIWYAQTKLTFVLQREPETSSLVILTYSLLTARWIDRDALPETCRSMPVRWLYDELALDGRAPNDGMAQGNRQSTSSLAAADSAALAHTILLSNGWELRLCFHQLSVSQPTGLFPGDKEQAAQAESGWQRSV